MRKALILAALIAAPAHATSLGPELVQNGTFDDASYWQIGPDWQISAGVASRGTGTSAPIEQATCSISQGVTYQASYTVNGSSGVPHHRFRIQYGAYYYNCPTAYGDGAYSCTFIAPAGVTKLVVQASGGFSGTVDNVSVREVLP